MANAKVYHSQFNGVAKLNPSIVNSSSSGIINQNYNDWRFESTHFRTITDAHIIEASYKIEDGNSTDYELKSDSLVAGIVGAGSIKAPLGPGIKKLSFHHAHYELDPWHYRFKVEILSENGSVLYSEAYECSIDESLWPQDKIWEKEFAVTQPCFFKVTNTGTASGKDIEDDEIFFWDFTWEDYAGDVVEDDNNLWWSQPSGDYAQNTFIMVRGNKGEELSLYNNDELQHVQPALDGVYPVIKYQLSDGDYNLKAVSGNNEPSYRTYRASATGAQPKLALSLPENSLYNIGTEITATGLPGKELTVTITDHENNVVDVPFKGTGIVDFDLRGSRDELITVTVEADGAETLTQSYYISRYWIPETRGAVFNFNEPGSLYIGRTPLDEYETDINLERITNVPDGVIWLTFSNASLTAANTLRMEAGSQVQIEALYEEGRTEIDLAEISFHYHSTARSASEPLIRIDDETSKHVAKYKAESAVELDGVSVSHNIITGIENVSVDSELPESYFDLQGRRLTQRPSKGLYVIRKGNHGQLMKAE